MLNALRYSSRIASLLRIIMRLIRLRMRRDRIACAAMNFILPVYKEALFRVKGAASFFMKAFDFLS
jgi:hypothetical protein